VSGDDVPEPAFDDDADTGPLRIPAPGPDPEPEQVADWDPRPAQSTWAGRFDGPLTVSPRQVRAHRTSNVPLIATAAVVAVVLIGGAIFWFTRPSSDDAEPTAAAPPSPATSSATATANDEDEAQLKRLLPRGYAADACEGADPAEAALAQLNCAANTDPDGPVSATYTLMPDRAALDTAFNATIAEAQRVNCPGNIQSPGPWRRNAAPQTVAGTLFCGLRDGQPTVVWTDDAKLTLNAVRSAPGGPTFPALYAWWSSHS
jgi:hypothetical protein